MSFKFPPTTKAQMTKAGTMGGDTARDVGAVAAPACSPNYGVLSDMGSPQLLLGSHLGRGILQLAICLEQRSPTCGPQTTMVHEFRKVGDRWSGTFTAFRWTLGGASGV